MTSEELNRAIQFLVEHQANFAVRFERDHEMMAASLKQLTEISEIQSRRLDQNDEAHRHYEKAQQQSQRRHEESEKRNAEFQKEALRMLHQILERLTRNPNSHPN